MVVTEKHGIISNNALIYVFKNPSIKTVVLNKRLKRQPRVLDVIKNTLRVHQIIFQDQKGQSYKLIDEKKRSLLRKYTS